MAQPRQCALGQVRQLHTELRQALTVLHETETRLGGPRANAQRDCVTRIREVIRQGSDIWPALQLLVFTDIKTLDECVITLNDWNNLFREAFETLRDSQRSLYLVVLKQYEAYFAIQEFLYELHKVVTRCMLHLGQLAPIAH